MLRITTSGVLKSYRLNLTKSHSNLLKAQNTVLTQRTFNSYSEDPAKASECFTLRRAFLRTSAQESTSQAVISQYEVAWNTLDTVISDVSNRQASSAFASVMQSLNSPTGTGRTALGDSLNQMAESLTQAMNVKYGDNYVFAGSNGLNAPFSWDGDQLCYQGIPVDTPDCTGLAVGDALPDGSTVTQEQLDNWNMLQKLESDTRYVDIGLGMQEDENGDLITASAFNSSMPGIKYLGYGTDEDGMPNNVISILKRMGTILSRCEEDGNWSKAHPDDQAEMEKLFSKLSDVSNKLSDKHVEMDTQAAFLKTNQEQLENTAYTLNEQIVGLEQVDLAEAISSFSWAQYCYNAALKVGNGILSETLMDFMSR